MQRVSIGSARLLKYLLCIGLASITLVTVAAQAQTPPPPSPPASTPITSAQKSQLAAQIRTAVAKCWTFDASKLDQTAAPVVVEFRLKPSGALANKPRVIAQRGRATSVALAQSAVAAVEACAPYTGLPANLFADGWSTIQLTFDASTAAAPAPAAQPAPGPKIIKGTTQ